MRRITVPATQAGDGAVSDEIIWAEKLLTLDGLKNLPTPEPIIDKFLYADTLAQMSGQPGTYKSFLALSWACAIASGLESWEGFPVRKCGKVVYIASEGASGVLLRVLAWAEATLPGPRNAGKRAALRENLLVLPAPLQLGARGQYTSFAEQAVELNPVLVVFDTRSRCTSSLDENSAKDMGDAVNAADLIRHKTGATVLFVHHMARSGTAARGSTVFDGAVWTNLILKSDRLKLIVTVDKHKDVETPERPYYFDMKPWTVANQALAHLPEERRTSLVVMTAGVSKPDETKGSKSHETGAKLSQLVSQHADIDGLTGAMIVKLANEFDISRPTVLRWLPKLVKDGALKHVDPNKRPLRYLPAVG